MTARPFTEQSEWTKSGLYWATVAYARMWLTADGINVRVTAACGGLTPGTLSRIVHEYRVGRGLNVKEHGRDVVHAKFCEILNGAAAHWPNSTLERAQFCLELLTQAKADRLVLKDQISLITKLMWFLRPNGWTVFDSYVADGAGVSTYGATLARMKEFYNNLSASGFDTLCLSMQPIIEAAGFEGMQSSRIIDMCLMHRGGMERDFLTVTDLRAFLAILPSSARYSLTTLGQNLQTSFGKHSLAVAAKREKA